MAIAGLVRLRKHQFGRQALINTPVAAKRVYGFKGVPAVDRQWTDPDVDLGGLAPIQAPYLQAGDFTAPLTSPSLRYNDLPLLFTTYFGGAEDSTGSGTAQTYDFAIDGVSASEPDLVTYEFGDDVTTDWYQLSDGFAETVEITGPDGGGALTASSTFRFGLMASSGSTDNGDSPSVPSSIDPDLNETVIYLKDASIFITSDPDDLDTAQVSDALHSFTLRLGGAVDVKRYANGTKSFAPSGHARTMLDIQLECSFAKVDTVTVGLTSESDAWMSNSAVTRYVRIAFESLENAETGPDVPYSWEFSMPMRYYTRTEGEIGGNTVVVLTGHAFVDTSEGGFDGLFATTFVNTLDSTSGL